MSLYEILKENSQNLEGKKIAEAAAGMVNCMGRQTKKLEEILGDEQTKKRFQKISVAYVKTLKQMWDADAYDGRNAAACEVASALCSYPGFSKIETITSWDGAAPVRTCPVKSLSEWSLKHGCFPDYDGVAAWNMAMEHRTLQQSFAELCFICIRKMFDELADSGADAYMESRVSYEWTALPFI